MKAIVKYNNNNNQNNEKIIQYIMKIQHRMIKKQRFKKLDLRTKTSNIRSNINSDILKIKKLSAQKLSKPLCSILILLIRLPYLPTKYLKHSKLELI